MLQLALPGTGAEYIWEEVKKISNKVSYDDTVKNLTYNLPNAAEGRNDTVFNREYNWKSLYGKLKSGEYRFTISTDGIFNICIVFTIQSNGKVSFQQPELI